MKNLSPPQHSLGQKHNRVNCPGTKFKELIRREVNLYDIGQIYTILQGLCLFFKVKVSFSLGPVNTYIDIFEKSYFLLRLAFPSCVNTILGALNVEIFENAGLLFSHGRTRKVVFECNDVDIHH